MKALVTGGAGFIGSNLVRALVERGDEVRVLDNFSTGRRANLAGLEDGIELIEGELRSYERVHNAVRSVEIVFHQGALPSVPRSIQDPLVPRFIAAVLSGEPLPIYGDGTQSRDFTYVGNVVDANLKAASTPGVTGMVFNVATGTPASVNDLADMIGSVLDRPVTRDYKPSRPGDVKDSWAHVEAARSLLGWTPTTGLTEGLRLTAELLSEARAPTPIPSGR